MAKGHRGRRRDHVVVPTDPATGAPATNQARTFQVIAGSSYSGPLPPPDLLAGFNAVAPGAADRIIAMAESQEAHRQQLENKYQAAQSRRSWGGLISAFLLTAGFLYASYSLIVQGFGLYGVFLGGGTIVSVVTVFIVGTTSQRNERQSRIDKLLGRNQ